MFTLITAKVHPDLDGVSCTLAYADLIGESAIGVIFGETQAEVEYFIKHEKINIAYSVDDGTGDYKNFALVDASSMKGMPKIRALTEPT